MLAPPGTYLFRMFQQMEMANDSHAENLCVAFRLLNFLFLFFHYGELCVAVNNSLCVYFDYYSDVLVNVVCVTSCTLSLSCVRYLLQMFPQLVCFARSFLSSWLL